MYSTVGSTRHRLGRSQSGQPLSSRLSILMLTKEVTALRLSLVAFSSAA